MEDIFSQFEDNLGTPLDPHRPWHDVWLLSLNGNHVWADDPEAGVCRGNQVYCHVLAEWSRISHGTFLPSEIQEYWETENGPLIVSFSLGNTRLSIDPIWNDDWLDLTILQQINELIVDSGKQFVCAADHNHATVFVCDENTRKTLEEIRGFPFTL
jgi:hypothetical protein